MKRRSAAFTLLELLAAMGLMALVMTAAVNFYIQLNRESAAAVKRTRHVRMTTAALDRMARELESTVLVVRPGNVDPLEHPWVFFAENQDGGEGADRVRFTTRAHWPRASAARESDLAVVAYGVRDTPDDTRELVRWTAPRLPEGLERDVPLDDDEGAQVLAEGVQGFGLRFLNEGGEWREAWDSSSLVDSNTLPIAVEIRLALADGVLAEEGAPAEHVRQVLLPIRPLDLEQLLASDDSEEAGSDEDEDGSDEEESDADDESLACVTVSECLASNPGLLDGTGIDPGAAQAVGDQCASDFGALGALPENCQ